MQRLTSSLLAVTLVAGGMAAVQNARSDTDEAQALKRARSGDEAAASVITPPSLPAAAVTSTNAGASVPSPVSITTAAPPAAATAAAPTTARASEPLARDTPATPTSSPQVSPTASFTSRFDDLRAGTDYADGTRFAGWHVVFNGYGSVSVQQDRGKVLSLSPMASARPDETHAALVATDEQFGNADIRVRMKSVNHLRTGSSPNPWEVAWLLWNYTDNTHFYSLVLKPNGWELGKEDPAYAGAQRFLATGEEPFPLGRFYDVRVRQVGNTMTVWVDGKPLTSYTDNERPYISGSVALYCEDSVVHFDNVSVNRL